MFICRCNTKNQYQLDIEFDRVFRSKLAIYIVRDRFSLVLLGCRCIPSVEFFRIPRNTIRSETVVSVKSGTEAEILIYSSLH